MPKPTIQKGYNYVIAKLSIFGVFMLAMVVLIPFFYGWINGKAHERICQAVGITSVWSCGLIVRDPAILQGYIQLSTPQSQLGPQGNTPAPSLPEGS